MALKYEKNYDDDGYLMHYKKFPQASYAKNQVLQFKIELLDIEPSIWRRIHVPYGYNFWDLHVAIQDAIGWKDYHLHHFEIKGKGKRNEVHIGIPDIYQQFGDESQEIYPGWEIEVVSYFNDLGVQAKYLYDYGDGWEHTVKLEGYLYKEKGVKYPLCIGGERACPPEDCGGIDGYYRVIKSLSDPKNPDYDAMKVWVGVNYIPGLFNCKNVKFDDPYRRWMKAFL